MAFAVVGSFALTAISIVALTLGYRSDALILKSQLHGALYRKDTRSLTFENFQHKALKARQGQFAHPPPSPNPKDAAAPTAAALFVGSQTYGVLAGWLVYFCGSFSLCFVFSWPPLRDFVISNTGIFFLITVPPSPPSPPLSVSPTHMNTPTY